MDDGVGFVVRRRRKDVAPGAGPRAATLSGASALPFSEGPTPTGPTDPSTDDDRRPNSGGGRPGAPGGGGGAGTDAELIARAVQALPHAIAVLDDLGDVRFGNAAWRRAISLTVGDGTKVGTNYLRLLGAALDDAGRMGPDGDLGRGVRGVLDRETAAVRERLTLVDAAGTTRHYLVDVVGLAGGGAVATHVDATAEIERRRAVERQVERDGLTDLLNHQGFHAQARRLLAAADRHQRTLHVLMVDLDRFKDVNDRYGHHVGDAVLVEVARRLAEAVREGDLAGRLGGDEFALVTEATGSADELAARLDATVCAPIRVEGVVVPVRCSIGSASFPSDGLTVDDLLRAADTGMYRTKRMHR